MTVFVNEPVAFEAIAYTADGEDFISSPEWSWEFDDGDGSAKNPTEHAYEKEGSYTVVVTASAKEGTGSAETTVEVIGDGGGGDALLGNDLYIRDPSTKARLGANEACDGVEVVFETSDMVTNGPTLYRQTPPQAPDLIWDSMGNGTSENTGDPNLRRWVWGWSTWEKNWPVNFKVKYKKPGTPPPYPPPMVEITVGPVTWTPNNTVVDGGVDTVYWDGTNPATLSWTVGHCAHRNPVFDMTVCIYKVGASSPVKTILLEDQPQGGHVLLWAGTTDIPIPGDPGHTMIAWPGVYIYTATAVHSGGNPVCSDTNKRASPLEFHATDFSYNLDVPPLGLLVNAWVRANQNADAVDAQLFHDDSGRLLDSDGLGSLAGDPNVWHQVLAYATIEPDDVDEFCLVGLGQQDAVAAQSNRSLAPKRFVPIARTFFLRPKAYCVAGGGVGGADEPAMEAKKHVAMVNLSGYMSPEGYLYRAEEGARDARALWTELGRSSIVLFAAHGYPNRQGMIRYSATQQLRGETVGEDPPENDEENAIYYIEKLPANTMAHCRFVFFAGCDTAVRTAAGASLLDAAVAQGADLAAGFRSYTFQSPSALRFHELFWQYALTGHMGVDAAARLAISEVRDQFNGDTGGTETFELQPHGADEELWRVSWGD